MGPITIAPGAVGWERDESHGVRDDEGVGLVPAGAVHDDDAVVVGELGGGVGEEQAHQVSIDPGEDEGGDAAIARAYRSGDVDELADVSPSQGQRESQSGSERHNGSNCSCGTRR